MMRLRGTGLIAAGLVAACVTYQQTEAGPVAVSSAPIPLYPANPDDRRAGALVYRGGLLLTSGERAFGGLSDLAVSVDGHEILAISDGGSWLNAKLTYDRTGNLAGMNSVEMAPILNREGKPVQGGARNACAGARAFLSVPFSTFWGSHS